MSRIEKGILDKFFNGYLLGRRQYWRPFKYVNTGTFRVNKWLESIVHPRNKFEQIYSDLVESMMPTLQYFFWNDLVASARQQGWTIQEKMYNNFFRNRNIYYHSMAQNLHPWGYLDRQRADGFFRRTETLIPGIDLPEWAQHTHRSPDFDIESISRTFESYRNLYEEATPSPHYNTPNYGCIQHFGNQRWTLGFWAQKLFFNEKPVGNFITNNGKYEPEDLKLQTGWYSGERSFRHERLKMMSEEDKKNFVAREQRWNEHIDTYFPEFKNVKSKVSSHVHEEANYQRNVEDIRDSMFIAKCMELFEGKAFSQDEIQAIYEYFIGGPECESAFFVVSSDDGYYHGTDLYKKFSQHFNLPDVFKINKASARTPEQTYLDRLDNNWNITFYTVDTYRKLTSKLMSTFNKSDFPGMEGQCRNVRNLVTEEVFNPLFRREASRKYNVHADLNAGQSTVVAVLKQNPNAIQELFALQEETRGAYPIANRQVRNSFLEKIRGYLKSRPFDSSL